MPDPVCPLCLRLSLAPEISFHLLLTIEGMRPRPRRTGRTGRIPASHPNPPIAISNVEPSGVEDPASITNSCESETGLPYEPTILVVTPVVRLVVQRAVAGDCAPAI